MKAFVEGRELAVPWEVSVGDVVEIRAEAAGQGTFARGERLGLTEDDLHRIAIANVTAD